VRRDDSVFISADLLKTLLTLIVGCKTVLQILNIFHSGTMLVRPYKRISCELLPENPTLA